MSVTPSDLMQDIVAMIEIELAYAAAEIQLAETCDDELGRAMEHIGSAVTLLRKLAIRADDRARSRGGENLCEV